MKSFIVAGLFAFTSACTFAQNPPSNEIAWTSITQAEQLNAKAPKKILIDIYTDWCGWCKRLDATTYKDPRIQQYISEHFYAVKLNAESKDNISFKGEDHTYNPTTRVNSIAPIFMQGSNGYPTTTFLDESLGVISVVPGYMNADMMLNVLKYIGEDIYKTTDWNTYLQQMQPTQQQ